MHAEHMGGAALAAVGAGWGLSGERVRQLLIEHGLPRAPHGGWRGRQERRLPPTREAAFERLAALGGALYRLAGEGWTDAAVRLGYGALHGAGEGHRAVLRRRSR